MAGKPAPTGDSWPMWLRVWFYIQLVVITWDAFFVLSRPYSFPGGPLAFLFPAFTTYMEVDKVYGNPEIPFGWAQSTMCLIENAILAFAMFVLHPKEQGKASRFTVAQPSDVIALAAVIMQFGKSIFYWIHDAYSGFSHVSHNSTKDLITLFVIPNAIWLVAPLFVFACLGGKIFKSLAAADKAAKAL